MPGPPPKRAAQRRRTNAPKRPTTTADGAAHVPIPRVNGRWHPVAKRWYTSLRHSGQSQFYEPSDWAVAYLIAESMSRDLMPQVVGVTDTGQVVKDTIPLKGASLAAYLKAMTQLLVTEGERRRVQLELERPDPGKDGDDDGKVTWLDQHRTGAG